MSLGAPELLIVLLVALLLFGGAKLPKLARSLGQAQSEFKKGLSENLDALERRSAETENKNVTLTKAELDALVSEKVREAQQQAGQEPRDG